MIWKKSSFSGSRLCFEKHGQVVEEKQATFWREMLVM
jgi:hypothetical protein